MEKGSMIQVTATAADKVKAYLAQEKESLPAGGLRLYAQPGGCSGFRYGLALDEPQDGDHIFESGGIKLIVDAASLEHLEGAEIDFHEDVTGGGFAINNPNAQGGCSCSHGEGGGGNCG
jgi:iron-sulfur cluster assembly protein